MAKTMSKLLTENDFSNNEIKLTQFVLNKLKEEHENNVDNSGLIKNKIEEVCKDEIEKPDSKQL